MTFNFRALEHYVMPKDVDVQITVSGGRSSAYALLHIFEANGGIPSNCVCTFQNTGFEMNQTLDFIARLDEYIGGQIVYLERDTAEPFKVKVVGHNSAARAGEPFKQLFYDPVAKRKDGTSGLRPLPNPVQRVCTAELKAKTADRYLVKHLGWKRPYLSVIGFRADEPKRVARRKRVNETRPKDEGGIAFFPMFDAGVTASDVFNFWRGSPLDLDLDSDLGNCDLCFMKSTWKIKMMMARFPERVQPWIDFEASERDRSNRFRKDRPSLAELREEVERGDFSSPPNDKECGTCGV